MYIASTEDFERDEICIVDVLGQKPYQIAKNVPKPFGRKKFLFDMSIRIDNFCSFVASKAKYQTSQITVNDDIECFISIELGKYCKTSKRCESLTPSDPADSLMIHFLGRSNGKKKNSEFDVQLVIKFKRTLLAGDSTLLFNSKNRHQDKFFLAKPIKVCLCLNTHT